MDFWGIVLGAGISTVTSYWAAHRSEIMSHRLRREARREDALCELASHLSRLERALANAGKYLPTLLHDGEPEELVSTEAIQRIHDAQNKIHEWRNLHAAHDFSRFDTFAAVVPFYAALKHHSLVSREIAAEAAMQVAELLEELRREIGRPVKDLAPPLLYEAPDVPELE